jgi:hypothetical protein
MAASGASSGGEAVATPSATPTSGSGDDAVAVISRRCSICHPAAQAVSFRADSTPEAQALIEDMIRRGAQLTAQEQPVLVQYFTQ